MRQILLFFLSKLHSAPKNTLEAITLDMKKNRIEQLEKVIQDDLFWMKQYNRKSGGFKDHNAFKTAQALTKYKKDWDCFHRFSSKVAAYVHEQGLEPAHGDYRDTLAELRMLSLKLEEGFNKDAAFELIFKVYEALEQRIS